MAEFRAFALIVPALRFLPAHLPWAARKRLIGHVDTVQDRRLHGWVWQPSAPEKRILVDIFVDGAFHGQQLAHRLRPDLLAQDIGDGRYGFEIDLADCNASTHRFDAFALGEKQRVRLMTSLATSPLRDDPVVSTAKDYIRMTFGTPYGGTADHDEGGVPAVQAQEPLYERLLAPSPIPSDPVMLGARLCGYLDLVRVRSNLCRFDPSLTPGQYRDFLRAYLESYGKIRGRDRAPLSAADIAFLNAPAADPDKGSRAQALWAADHDLPPPERAFLWAAFLAPALSVEDCLIPPGDIVALSQIVPRRPVPADAFHDRAP